jgi:hypothetical protein
VLHGGGITDFQESVGKPFLDHILLATTTDDEIIDSMPLRDLHLQNLPENGPAADFHYGLGLQVSFLADAGPSSSARITAFLS